ncbi:MAG: putative membrane protein [Planctomycetota bacterium]|jgi:uncharacterized membrane protein
MENITLAIVLDFTGTLLIAYAVVMVHRSVLKEHHMDKQVYKIMRLEQKLAILGMTMIVVSFILNYLI